MNNLNVAEVAPAVAQKITPMIEDLLREHAENVHSIHIVGSAVIADYDAKLSDVNSLVLLRDMDLGFLEFLAPLGKKYGNKHVAAPLVMTPEYIQQSLDSFPVEFLDFKLIHKTVYGEDILQGLHIARHDLRVQCEREIKSKLINLRQGYLSSLGKKDPLAQTLVRSITGSMALFRAIITLLGKEPLLSRAEVITMLASASIPDSEIFTSLLRLKTGHIKPSEQELHGLFKRYYHALDAAGKIINDLQA